MKKLLFLALLLLLTLGLGFAFSQSKYDFKAASLEGEFVLSKVKKPVILYFGYTYCPDVCPTTLFLVDKAMRELDLDAQIAFVSVDLERDSLPDCDAYAKHFRDDAICLRLEQKELDKVAKNYDAKYKIEKNNNEISVSHTPYVYLLKNAKLVSQITNLAPKSLKKELEKLK